MPFAEIAASTKAADALKSLDISSAELMSSDLRASAALVLAAISAKGKSIVSRVYHCDRGYEKFEDKLKRIGVNIKRISWWVNNF